MDTATRVPTVWNQLAEAMYLKDSPSAQVKLSERASFSFGRFGSSEGLQEIARPLVGERGYIVALQLKEIPFMQQFLGSRKVASGSYQIGGVSAIDLQDEPAVLLPNPFDTLIQYVTQDALDEIAYAHQVPRVERLRWPLGAFDPVVHHLGQTLLTTLDEPLHAPKIFLDHVLQALCLLLRRRETIRSKISRRTLPLADAKSNGIIGSSPGWQHRPSADC